MGKRAGGGGGVGLHRGEDNLDEKKAVIVHVMRGRNRNESKGKFMD